MRINTPFKSKLGKNKLKMQSLESYSLKISPSNFAAGVYPVCLKTKKILLCKRGPKLETEPNKWCNLGGKSNPYETPYENAVREFFEESGRYIPIKLIQFLVSEKKDGFKYYNFIGLVDYEFIPVTNKLTVDFEVEISDYKWLTLDEFFKFPAKDLHWGAELFRKECKKQLLELFGPK
jgi:8-oxo-dGTP pyrophosphatase MutT (NUDIX family)